MSERAIAGVISFCVAITGIFLANMFLMMMTGEINRRSEEGERISYFGFTLPKMLRIFSDCRRLHPSGMLHVYALGAFALGMLGLVSTGVFFYIMGVWPQG